MLSTPSVYKIINLLWGHMEFSKHAPDMNNKAQYIFENRQISPISYMHNSVVYRGVATGVCVGGGALPEFCRSFSPIQTKEGKLCPTYYILPAPLVSKRIYTSGFVT